MQKSAREREKKGKDFFILWKEKKRGKEKRCVV